MIHDIRDYKMTKSVRKNTEQYLHLYKQMVRIRTFEENANQLYLNAKMPGLTHMYIGQEAVAVGICEALENTDRITSTHRGHGHCLPKGPNSGRCFVNCLARQKVTAGVGWINAHCRSGQWHLGANAIVGGSMGIATGAALSAKLLRTKTVAVCFFGDGATAQGLWYEVMNMAALWQLPIIYACENNGYSEYTPTTKLQQDP